MRRAKIRLKILPPFTRNFKSLEVSLTVERGSKLADLIKDLSKKGLITIDKIINNGRLKDYVVILVNGITVFDLSHVVSDGDRIVVMPLASGG